MAENRETGVKVFLIAQSYMPAQDIHILRNLNDAGPVIDFGPVSTDGSVAIHTDGGQWTMQTMPRDRAFADEARGFPDACLDGIVGCRRNPCPA